MIVLIIIIVDILAITALVVLREEIPEIHVSVIVVFSISYTMLIPLAIFWSIYISKRMSHSSIIISKKTVSELREITINYIRHIQCASFEANNSPSNSENVTIVANGG